MQDYGYAPWGLLGDLVRNGFLYEGHQPRAHTQWERDALAAQGGIDTRESETGVPDFSTLGAQARLMGADLMGKLSDPLALAQLSRIATQQTGKKPRRGLLDLWGSW